MYFVINLCKILKIWFLLMVEKMTGIMFQDITTLLLDPKAFKDTVDLFVERYKGKNISVVAGKKKKVNEKLKKTTTPTVLNVLKI